MTFRCHRDVKPAEAASHSNRWKSTPGSIDGYAVNSVSFHPTNMDVFATAGADSHFALWDLDSKTRIRAFPKLGGAVTSLAWSRDGAAIAYAVGYDWSRGHAGNVSTYPRALKVHVLTKDEVGNKQ